MVIFFSYLSPKAKETRAQINEWGLINLKMHLHCKRNHQQNEKKKKATKWEKIFANDMTDKELISKIYQ